MVQFRVKTTTVEFLFDTSIDLGVIETIESLVNILNSILKLQRIVYLLPDLAKFGPLRPEETRGLTETVDKEILEKERQQCEPHNPNYVYNPDPSGFRTGQAPNQQCQDVLNKTTDEINHLINKDRLKGEPITQQQLDDAIQTIKGAVMIAYPQGLPDCDPMKFMLDGTEDLDMCSNAKEILDPTNAMVWFTTRQLERGKTLKDCLARSCVTDKSKVIVKLTKPTPHPPPREPYMSEEQQKQMMAFYYKRQRELEEISKDNDDSYLTAEWADPTQLRNKLTNQRNIDWK
ncbi:putative Cilia- and flagella-associated protein 298 [Blattamonas nauphoetae]|uniref:Cilia- and flagella-associated protein 298 n=1 Tax=Blattamonas nauphoetae TaxID=2049346 RepID=A0ABQ9YAY8_9EUKA|nr:putative Cilia- and flagella-associated protein 298 [Blattamonas nauphoetae]